MNLVNLSVQVKKIKMEVNFVHSLSFSLRLGRLTSPFVSFLPPSATDVIYPEIQLSLSCEESIINSNTRASLIIYQQQPNSKKDIIGIVFIPLSNPQDQILAYDIQQSEDPAASIQLVFGILSLQVKQTQNESMASKSSLAEIREIHHVLTKQHKKTSSHLFPEEQNIRKSRLSPMEKDQRQSKLKNLNGNKLHLKSEQSQVVDQSNEKWSYEIRKLQQELSKERQRSSILINLLIIQQQKNTQSEGFIKMLIDKLEIKKMRRTSRDDQIIDGTIPKIDLIVEQNKQEEVLIRFESKIMTEQKKNEEKQAQQEIMKSYQSEKLSEQMKYLKQKLQTMTAERDQLFRISDQLYDKTKTYKIENENIYKVKKHLEDELNYCINENKELEKENIDLKKQLFNIEDNRQSSQQYQKAINLLKKENQSQRQINSELDRKFKQTFRALDQLRQDIWKSQQELTSRQQQILLLKEEIAHYQALVQQQKFYPKKQNQGLKRDMNINQAVDTLQSLLETNRAQRRLIQEKLSVLWKQKQDEQMNPRERLLTMNKVKQKIDEVYEELKRQNKRQVSLIEIKRRLSLKINSLIF